MPLHDDDNDPEQTITPENKTWYLTPLRTITIDETRNQILGIERVLDLTQTERIFFQGDLSKGFKMHDIRKLAHFILDCFINASDRDMVEERLENVALMQGYKSVVVFRPSKSEPGKIVTSATAIGGTNCFHAYVDPTREPLSDVYDLIRNLPYQWLPEAERKHKLIPKGTLFCQELGAKQKELDHEIIDLQARGENLFLDTMNRDEAEKALQGKENGIFIIRLSATKNKDNNIYVLSLVQDNKISHTKIEIDSTGKLSIDPMLYDSLSEYLTYAKNSKLISKPFTPSGEKGEMPYMYES